MDARYRLIVTQPGQAPQEFEAPIDELADILNRFGIVADLGPLQSLAVGRGGDPKGRQRNNRHVPEGDKLAG